MHSKKIKIKSYFINPLGLAKQACDIFAEREISGCLGMLVPLISGTKQLDKLKSKLSNPLIGMFI